MGSVSHWRKECEATFVNSEHWIISRDGDKGLLALFERHYSCYHYKDGRVRSRFVGPGERIVLSTLWYDAGFVWRKFKDASGQQGVNCSFFRNESSARSSDLILEAMEYAFERWPGERLYTYVKAEAIRSTNPGYCYKVVGWRECGITKARKLRILEYVPKNNVTVYLPAVQIKPVEVAV